MTAMTVTSAFLCILVWATLPDKGSSFLLDAQQCIGLPPCTCSRYYGYNVDCTWNTTSMPTFEITNVTENLHISIYRTHITSIPAYAFRNLSLSSTTGVVLDLHSNQLSSISKNAFAGIENRVTRVDLQTNQFTTVPLELTSLPNLSILAIESNPIRTLSASTMHALGRHLQTLYIDLNHFSTWPTQLNMMTSLTNLGIQHLDMTHLDYNVFDVFAKTLTSLGLQTTRLEKIPVAVCHLHNLRDLRFTHHFYVHINSTILEPCSRELTSVTSVSLDHNNLRYMPNVFNSFPSMTHLEIYGNRLSYIHSDIIPTNHPLRVLDAYNNEFTRIPSAINKLHALETLDMANNKITSVEDFDLTSLSHLNSLDLNGNPIEYISPTAFKYNPALNYLYLQNTHLRQLPSSIAGLHNLRTLYLQGSPIECNCDLSYLKPLDVNVIYINGNCQTSLLVLPVKTYLKDDLPNCP